MSAAFDARLGPHAEAPASPLLNKPMDPRFALGILAVLAHWPVLHGVFDPNRHC